MDGVVVIVLPDGSTATMPASECTHPAEYWDLDYEADRDNEGRQIGWAEFWVCAACGKRDPDKKEQEIPF